MKLTSPVLIAFVVGAVFSLLIALAFPGIIAALIVLSVVCLAVYARLYPTVIADLFVKYVGQGKRPDLK